MHSKASRRYSLALYGVAEEKNSLDQIIKDINYCLSLTKSNYDLELFFRSPVIPKSKKISVVNEILKGKVSELVMSFIILLLERRRGELMLEIFEDFIKLKKEKDGIVDVLVKTSFPLGEDERSSMKKKIDSYTKKNGNLSFEIDKTIIGGFVARINDTILDASIKRQLEILKDKFRQGDFSMN